MNNIRISFVKDFWPHVSGDQAILNRRVGEWFVAAGWAVRIPFVQEKVVVAVTPPEPVEDYKFIEDPILDELEEVLPPMMPDPPAVPLKKRGRKPRWA